MGGKRGQDMDSLASARKPKNKLRRQELHQRQKKTHESEKRDRRFRRKRDEAKNPSLREERRKHHVPMTLERKRKWDDDLGQDDAGLGVAVDLERWKGPRPPEGADEGISEKNNNATSDDQEDGSVQASDRDSMLEFGSEDEDTERDKSRSKRQSVSERPRPEPSVSESTTGARLDLAPEALLAKFPTLFTSAPATPKTLVTTSLHSTLHHEARILTTLFPNSVYIPRSAHRYSHNFSVREISKFASNRNYTLLVLLKEDQKRLTGLSLVHLPEGPTFHFSISNWVEGKKLPGHGNPTNHIPELILNNFRTPLGLLTAHLFRSIFPTQPELQGRQVVTLHNQRDYIFVRRHRYVFRDKRPTEKSVVGPDGKEVKGVEEIRAGLQELGPRFTMKLRRIDKGIGRAGSNGQVEWEWKGRMDKQRTKFQL
ncbi:MAG: hypothetical protein M1823_001704 [Watsoniomyces obsoletus]|nr:MAG: hypothetical protein M1823_001704 [Watsoniomyces obsoletus]